MAPGMTTKHAMKCRKKNLAPRLLPLVVLGAATIAYFGLDLQQYFTVDALCEHRERLSVWIDGNFVVASPAFVAAYASGVGFLFPSGSVMTVAGGEAVARRFSARTRRSWNSQNGGRCPGQRAELHAGAARNCSFSILARRLGPRVPRRSLESVRYWNLFRYRPRHRRVRGFRRRIGQRVRLQPGEIAIRDPTPEILAVLVGLGLLSLIAVVYKRKRLPEPDTEAVHGANRQVQRHTAATPRGRGERDHNVSLTATGGIILLCLGKDAGTRPCPGDCRRASSR